MQLMDKILYNEWIMNTLLLGAKAGPIEIAEIGVCQRGLGRDPLGGHVQQHLLFDKWEMATTRMHASTLRRSMARGSTVDSRP